MPLPRITVSVVSHRQNALVNELLGDLARSCSDDVSLVLTQNVPDPVPVATEKLACPVEVIRNEQVKGFGANHNAAFVRCCTPFFCVANPDIRLASNPFPALLQSLQDKRAGAVGPVVRSPAGTVEDSARRFPTVGILMRKVLGAQSKPDYAANQEPLEVDWVAGMFMLFRSEAYRSVGGFDEAYFLYYEDVDLCRRLRSSGNTIIYNPNAEVVHDARRASRRDLRMARHHLASAIRYFLSA